MSEESKNPLHVVELRAENFKRLKAVRIKPESNVVIIGGDNFQGKSTVLDCLLVAMGGAKVAPAEPIRRGEKEANIFLDLGEITVELTFDQKNGRQLVVRNADGKKLASPQSILDKLYNAVAFNPLEFASHDKAKRVAILKRLAGIDFVDLDSERNTVYEKRTGVGRVRADAEARMLTFPTSCASAPDEEVSVVGLMAEYEHAEEQNYRVGERASALEYAKQKVTYAEAALAEAKRCEAVAQARLEEVGQRIDTAPISEKLKGAEDVNRVVRAKKDRAKAVEDFKAKDREYTTLTKRIEEIDEAKADRLSKAKWPIQGIGFGDDDITFNGLPWEQASSAEQLKVSLSIGIALNPRLRVLRVPDASLLDKKSMQIIRDTAAAENFSMWIERVGDGDEGAVIIEDGEVAYNTEV
jgi:hypothetical protein